MTWCGIFVINCDYINIARKQVVVYGQRRSIYALITTLLLTIGSQLYWIGRSVVDRSRLDTSYFTISHGYERSQSIALRSISKTPWDHRLAPHSRQIDSDHQPYLTYLTCAKLKAATCIVLVWDYSAVSVVGKFYVNHYSIALIILPQYYQITEFWWKKLCAINSYKSLNTRLDYSCYFYV
jgi:hypothetical protein